MDASADLESRVGPPPRALTAGQLLFRATGVPKRDSPTTTLASATRSVRLSAQLGVSGWLKRLPVAAFALSYFAKQAPNASRRGVGRLVA